MIAFVVVLLQLSCGAGLSLLTSPAPIARPHLLSKDVYHGVNTYLPTSSRQSSLLISVAAVRQKAKTPLFAAGRPSSADDDDDDDDDDDYNMEFDLNKQKAQLEKQVPKMYSYGLNKGRSAPSQRKAMGTTSSESAIVNICTHCGSESIQWFGQCPTCREWNTIQPMSVKRSASNSRPTFAPSSASTKSGAGGANKSKGPKRQVGGYNENNHGDNEAFEDPFTTRHKSASWLGGSASYNRFDAYSAHTPRRITDIHKQMRDDRRKELGDDGDGDDNGDLALFERRLVVPNNLELNQVLGGGIMPGSLTLLGGDPGVGKSTLLLQMAAAVASLATPTVGIGMGKGSPSPTSNGGEPIGPAWYVSGEENSWQIAARAARLGIDATELMLLCDTDADYVADLIANPQADATRPGADIKFPSLVVIDSIQTMLCEAGGNSASGGVTQVRETVGLFLRLAKSTGIPIVMIGHVTKTGDVAGPRTVEHMVDCVLYLEGDNHGGGNTNIRMLRAAKNRFGSSDEIGVYTMSDGDGGGGGALTPVSDPSTLFLSTRMDDRDSEGCAVSIVLEGSRCMTAEVQALVAGVSGFNKAAVGRRTVDGVSMSRVLLILAVLDKRLGIRFARQDVYVNVVGGIRLSSNGSKKGGDGSSSDLAVAVSLVSSLACIPVRADTAFVGEIGLVGELRPVPSLKKRITEARRMGFSRIVIPKRFGGGGSNSNKKKNSKWNQKSPDDMLPESNKMTDIEVIECDNLLSAINEGLVTKLYPDGPKKGKSKKEGYTASPAFPKPSSPRRKGPRSRPKTDGSNQADKPWRDVNELLIITDDGDDDDGDKGGSDEEEVDDFPYSTDRDFQ
jgi:DNA repair protein RadA/Sms